MIPRRNSREPLALAMERMTVSERFLGRIIGVALNVVIAVSAAECHSSSELTQAGADSVAQSTPSLFCEAYDGYPYHPRARAARE